MHKSTRSHVKNFDWLLKEIFTFSYPIYLGTIYVEPNKLRELMQCNRYSNPPNSHAKRAKKKKKEDRNERLCSNTADQQQSEHSWPYNYSNAPTNRLGTRGGKVLAKHTS